MGNFMAVTGFHTSDHSEIVDFVVQYAKRNRVGVELLNGNTPPKEETDALIYNPENGWSIIFWPRYFSANDFPLARAYARAKNICVSSLHVYDSDYWEHIFLNGDQVEHLFCSSPNFWEEEEEEIRNWIDDPAQMCKTLSIPVASVEKYLVDVGLEELSGKAYPDDQFELDDFWVMVDFWRKLGINYPEGDHAKILRLEKDFLDKLPYE